MGHRLRALNLDFSYFLGDVLGQAALRLRY